GKFQNGGGFLARQLIRLRAKTRTIRLPIFPGIKRIKTQRRDGRKFLRQRKIGEKARRIDRGRQKRIGGSRRRRRLGRGRAGRSTRIGGIHKRHSQRRRRNDNA